MAFLSAQEALNFSLTLEPMQVEQMPTAPILSPAERIETDKSFCFFLTDRFLKENREAGITEAESLELMQQFSSIMSFAQVGAVPTVQSLLQGVTVGRVYTQERKNKDLTDIQNYLNQ